MDRFVFGRVKTLINTTMFDNLSDADIRRIRGESEEARLQRRELQKNLQALKDILAQLDAWMEANSSEMPPTTTKFAVPKRKFGESN